MLKKISLVLKNIFFSIPQNIGSLVHEFVERLSKKKLIFMAVLISVFILISVIVLFSGNKYAIALLFSLMLFFSILFFLLFKEKKIIFEPIYLFSLYYLTVCIVIWYLAYSNFETDLFTNNTTFSNDKTFLFAITVFYFFIGYICTLFGYFSVKNNEEFDLQYEKKNVISNFALKFTIILFFSIGLFNFMYNVFYFADGNMILYLKNISLRTLEFANGGTTLGYIFAETSIYVWLFMLLRKKKYFSFPFLICLFITILMKVSVGRIFQTFVLIGCIVGIYYFIELKNKVSNNKKYFIIGGAILVGGIVVYYLRLASNLAIIGKLDDGFIQSFELFIKNLGYYAVDKGNMPNVSVVMKIIDSWNSDVGFLFGSSLFYFVFSLFSINLIPIPSVIIKQTWFQHIQGGNLPPTGIGEMYANFGFLGPILGMFIFGIVIALFYKMMIKRKNYWFLVCFIQITVGFIALFPKGEFSNLTLWSIAPITLTYIFLRFLTKFEIRVSSVLKKRGT